MEKRPILISALLFIATGCATFAPERISAAEALRDESMLVPLSSAPNTPFEAQLAMPGKNAVKRKPTQPAAFVWPLTPVVVNSPFGHRFHPISGSYVFHAGLDLEAYKKQRVVSAFAGRVVFAGRNGAHGNHVEVQHGKRYVTRYSHLESIRVSAGDWVDQGAVVGTAGATGHVTGVHLHFEVWKDGHPADPLDVLPDPDGPRTLVHQTAW